ncbi:hypothetical protein HK102_004232 [Quaeritorhiza haematococci]|nr:hypothetical protein HK102_004232 [Quaeritorhiza haematococci]
MQSNQVALNDLAAVHRDNHDTENQTTDITRAGNPLEQELLKLGTLLDLDLAFMNNRTKSADAEAVNQQPQQKLGVRDELRNGAVVGSATDGGFLSEKAVTPSASDVDILANALLTFRTNPQEENHQIALKMLKNDHPGTPLHIETHEKSRRTSIEAGSPVSEMVSHFNNIIADMSASVKASSPRESCGQRRDSAVIGQPTATAAENMKAGDSLVRSSSGAKFNHDQHLQTAENLSQTIASPPSAPDSHDHAECTSGSNLRQSSADNLLEELRTADSLAKQLADALGGSNGSENTQKNCETVSGDAISTEKRSPKQNHVSHMTATMERPAPMVQAVTDIKAPENDEDQGEPSVPIAANQEVKANAVKQSPAAKSPQTEQPPKSATSSNSSIFREIEPPSPSRANVGLVQRSKNLSVSTSSLVESHSQANSDRHTNLSRATSASTGALNALQRFINPFEPQATNSPTSSNPNIYRDIQSISPTRMNVGLVRHGKTVSMSTSSLVESNPQSNTSSNTNLSRQFSVSSGSLNSPGSPQRIANPFSPERMTRQYLARDMSHPSIVNSVSDAASSKAESIHSHRSFGSTISLDESASLCSNPLRADEMELQATAVFQGAPCDFKAKNGKLYCYEHGKSKPYGRLFPVQMQHIAGASQNGRSVIIYVTPPRRDGKSPTKIRKLELEFPQAQTANRWALDLNFVASKGT